MGEIRNWNIFQIVTESKPINNTHSLKKKYPKREIKQKSKQKNPTDKEKNKTKICYVYLRKISNMPIVSILKIQKDNKK